jgi:hypothetical protein
MMKDHLTGYGRDLQQHKQDGDIEFKEGKDPFSFADYRQLCKLAWAEIDTTQRMFAASYATMLWNIGARNHSVGHMKYSHIFWEGDCLVILIYP